MQTHELKTVSSYWDAIERGEKLFEVRKNDRFFQVGDIVELLRFEDRTNGLGRAVYTNDKGRWSIPIEGMEVTDDPKYAKRLRFRIGPILQGGQFGIEPGYCVFSLLPPAPPQSQEETK